MLQWIRFSVLLVFVGCIAGLGAIFFRELIGFFHNLLFYGTLSTEYNVLQHAAPSAWGAGIIFVPVVGAMVVAFLVKNYAPEAKGHGVPEVMEAIYYKKSVVRPIVALVKSIASSISIGSGGSIGREGPIIQIGAAFGSALGQWCHVPIWQRMTLVACGAGGGIAATFNTPVGGILFAWEIMLSELSPRTIIPVCIATAIATYISEFYFGSAPFIQFTGKIVTDITAAGAISYLFLSVAVGLLSAFFIRAIYFAEDRFDAMPGGYYVRHGVGMLMVGISLYLMMQQFGHYYLQGVGYATVVDVLQSVLTHPWFLFLLAFLKIIDTAITLGSGGSGGIFSPLLFIGATFGAGFLALCNTWFPGHQDISLLLGALAGMAGMVGASTAAPLTAIVMTAELINDYAIMLPLIIVVAVSYAARRLIIRDSIYTLKLTRRGLTIPEKMGAGVGS